MKCIGMKFEAFGWVSESRVIDLTTKVVLHGD